MSNPARTEVLVDTGFIDDVEEYCRTRPSTKNGTHLRTMELVFFRDDSISYKRTQTFTGLNKHSGKRWFKAVTEKHCTYKVRELSNGKKYLYVWDIPANRKYRKHPIDTPPSGFPTDSRLNDIVLEFCEKQIGPLPEYLDHLSTTKKVWHYSRPNFVLISGLRQGDSDLRKKRISLRTSDPNTILKHYLGNRYSKKLSGLLRGRTSVQFLKSLEKLPEDFKTEWVLDYVKENLKNNPSAYFGHEFRFSTSSYMSEVVPYGFKKQLLNIFLAQPYVVVDIFRLYRRLGVTKDTFKEYKVNLTEDYYTLELEHDRLSELVRDLEDKNYTKPYDLEPIPEGLGKLGFRLPTSNKDLSSWSKHFSNCVSGYSNEVSTGDTLVLNWNDEVCLEVNNKKLKQFLGKYNNPTTPEKFWEGVDLLLKHGMIEEEPNKNECWGFQPLPQKEVVTQ